MIANLPPLPTCVECGKPVSRKWIVTPEEYSVGDLHSSGKLVQAVREDKRYWKNRGWLVWLGDYSPKLCQGYFDSTKCAQAYAVKAVKANGRS